MKEEKQGKQENRKIGNDVYQTQTDRQTDKQSKYIDT